MVKLDLMNGLNCKIILLISIFNTLVSITMESKNINLNAAQYIER
jgi:hypothetical protein